jgi:sirohydrochlorin cobaltochelatase
VQTPDHEELVVPKSPETTEVFLSCHPQDRRASSFIFLSCTLCLVQTAIYPAGKDKTMRKIETKKLAAAVTALALCAGVLTGCGGAASGTASSTAASSASSEASSEGADEMAAKNVADLIDAIYVQERNDDTDAQCEAAKAAWDALTDTQKELVEGENADPDYFGRDTGDASKDDARNQDDIGDNELLVVSFGTSFNDSRVKDIKGIEDALQAAYPDWSVRRAFTAQIIINHVQARDGEKIDNMQQAMDRAVENGVKNLVVQPTHLMHGAEYDEMMEMIDTYRDKFESVAVAEPLLGEVGSDATIINQDKEDVAKAVTAAAVKEAGYDSLDAAAADKVAFVFMGHGTSHTAKVSYSQMQTTMQTLGYDNVFIGTVEGKPEETACENVIEAVKAAGYTKVILRPLMVVAGDHANNDMAGEDADSWLSQFKASGAFDSIDCQIAGLGGIEDVQKLYVAHTKAAIDSLNG